MGIRLKEMDGARLNTSLCSAIWVFPHCKVACLCVVAPVLQVCPSSFYPTPKDDEPGEHSSSHSHTHDTDAEASEPTGPVVLADGTVLDDEAAGSFGVGVLEEDDAEVSADGGIAATAQPRCVLAAV